MITNIKKFLKRLKEVVWIRTKLEGLLLSVTSTLVWYLKARLELTLVDVTLVYGWAPRIAFKYQTRMEATDCDKHSILIWYGIYYSCKNLIVYAP